ncbi:MAG TPA: ATP-dependent DNA helicase RecQ [Acidobacteriota bacterium]|nr:ATP-dependent DNA helicase RecQ [Acidobacteriota bacterium]
MASIRDQLRPTLKNVFRHRSFRPFQEEVCHAVASGKDTLVVMPTGAGKSLCYQLPGLVRGGTTLVVSPLIALMEDQADKLRQLDLRAERIHSGRSRAESRQACVEYLSGRLDFLFIAPERLRVPGFPEMLAKRKPTLIAVDEAHCISHWGHDFRHDYRMLGERLPLLRPAPVAALTATATELVQDDIAAQLALDAEARFIHGFRRDNIAIEVAELPAPGRPEAVRQLLSDKARRPAIVYVPSRKQADELGLQMNAVARSAAYHAGLSSERREQVQRRFQDSKLDVVVATIAFGMGIDKPDIRTVIHTGLPGSLEAYYQEIGRAGRDGEPARAVLLYSRDDRRIQEYFHERNYPQVSVLEEAHRRLQRRPQSTGRLCEACGMEPEIFLNALEKLWIHGGAEGHPRRGLRRGQADWRKPYQEQRDYKKAQLDQMTDFAEGSGCRMVHLVDYFGDRDDGGRACGCCDVCDPRELAVTLERQATDVEQDIAQAVLEDLRRWDNRGSTQLYKDVCGVGGVERSLFDRVLANLAAQRLIRLRSDSFEKNGRTIRFQRVSLTARGFRSGADPITISLTESL